MGKSSARERDGRERGRVRRNWSWREEERDGGVTGERINGREKGQERGRARGRKAEREGVWREESPEVRL